MSRLLTPGQVAELLGLRPRTVLNQLSLHRRGLPAAPWASLPWIYLPRPRLDEEVLEAFIKEHLPRASGTPAAELVELAEVLGRLHPAEAERLRAIARRWPGATTAERTR